MTVPAADPPPFPSPLMPEGLRMSRRERRLLAEVHAKIAAGASLWTHPDGGSEWVYTQPVAERRQP